MRYAMTAKSAIRDWLDGSTYTVKGLSMAIDSLSADLECTKLLLKRARDMRIQLITKQELKLDHKSKLLSVRCDGRTISISFLGSGADSLEKGILKRLGFSWSKDKLEYVRKVAGADIGAIKGFVGEVES
jgi:hypothetical protein